MLVTSGPKNVYYLVKVSLIYLHICILYTLNLYSLLYVIYTSIKLFLRIFILKKVTLEQCRQFKNISFSRCNKSYHKSQGVLGKKVVDLLYYVVRKRLTDEKRLSHIDFSGKDVPDKKATRGVWGEEHPEGSCAWHLEKQQGSQCGWSIESNKLIHR